MVAHWNCILEMKCCNINSVNCLIERSDVRSQDGFGHQLHGQETLIVSDCWETLSSLSTTPFTHTHTHTGQLIIHPMIPFVCRRCSTRIIFSTSSRLLDMSSWALQLHSCTTLRLQALISNFGPQNDKKRPDLTTLMSSQTLALCGCLNDDFYTTVSTVADLNVNFFS